MYPKPHNNKIMFVAEVVSVHRFCMSEHSSGKLCECYVILLCILNREKPISMLYVSLS